MAKVKPDDPIWGLALNQSGCQLNLSEGQIRLDLTSGRPLV